MQVQIAPGYCWIKGHFGFAENTESVTIAMADGSLPRIDRITARLDFSSNSVHLHVITGTPAETPAPPSVVRDGTYYDIGLATVALPAGALRVTNAMITDTRSDNTVCGAVIYRNADGMALDGKADKTVLQAVKNELIQLDSRITSVYNYAAGVDAKRFKIEELSISSGTQQTSVSIGVNKNYVGVHIDGVVEMYYAGSGDSVSSRYARFSLNAFFGSEQTTTATALYEINSNKLEYSSIDINVAAGSSNIVVSSSNHRSSVSGYSNAYIAYITVTNCMIEVYE